MTKKEKMMERNIPRPGELYKHFKDNLYQIITVASHTETGEKMVVYQALYGDFKTYVRPLDMFLSKVDKEKYKDVTSEYRFELFIPNKDNIEQYKKEDPITFTDENIRNNSGVNPILMEFLDADTYAEKLSILNKNRKQITDQILNDMAISLDVTVEEGDIDTRIDGFIFCLQTFIRFEDRRLR